MKPSRFFDEIIQKTTGEIRTFLDELANGTSNYKSLHNLTEQVEHQYHGRFLIELIQNAHDALFEEEVKGDKGRLEIVIAGEEQPFGALYVANDGLPFTSSNFQHLSRFGQSDKNPEKHIGNKGIGFRSVLEITKAPEIYSRSTANTKTFDGYCFCFEPDVTNQFEDSIKELLHGVEQPQSPFDPRIPLVEWGEEKQRAFLSRCSSLGHEWIIKEFSYLSPYLLPIPISNDRNNSLIPDFEVRGLATVIRLPFMSEEARNLAVLELDRLDENTVLFLNRLKSLWLDSGSRQRLVIRKKKRLGDKKSGYEIQIEVTETEQENIKTKRYWLWEQHIGGEENPTEAELLRDAVSDLPGKWPELRKATVAFAVRIGDLPEKGKINIFLPTDLASGCAAHLSGPFYGDMSRTHIHFEHPYNQHLLTRIAKESLDVIRNSLARKSLDEAAAIIDLLSPFPSAGESGNRWWSLIQKACSDKEIELKEQAIAFADNGWNSIIHTSLLPDQKDPKVITEQELRAETAFPVYHRGLLCRKDQIIELYKAIGIGVFPSAQNLADTVERIARKLHRSYENLDWNGFWHDASKLFPDNAELLRGKTVLLGTDNELHASSENCSVFFRPRSGGTDDEILSEGAIDDIPRHLRPFIAFLHESIEVHVPGPEGGIRVTPIQRYLSSALVQPFGVEQILRNVLIPATPALPISLGSKQEGLCRAIIQWGLRLVANLVAKDKGENTLKYLGRLPVPCQGGWFTLNDASFGHGWNETIGEHLQEYLLGARTEESREAMDRLMLPPDHELWGGVASSNQDLLSKAGVFNGLRLVKVSPEDWHSTCYVSGGAEVRLPEKPPRCFDEGQWKTYLDLVAKNLRPYFKGWFKYEVQRLYALPGLDKFEEFDSHTGSAFMIVLLHSLPKWQEYWGELNLKKIGGQSHSFRPESPLHFWLREVSWLVFAKDNKIEYFRLRERWYIPPLVLADRFHHFTHLNPLPGEMADILEDNPELVEALEDPKVEITNMDVFLGQVRMAWSLFQPAEDAPFPKRIIVQNSPMRLQAVIPLEEDPIYLQDTTSSFHEGLELHSKPIVAMIETKDAKRLAEKFRNAYGRGLRLASELKMQPLVGGEPWEGDTGEPISISELKWLMPVVLSVFAFSGGQAKGTQTKSFSKAIGSLRGTKICWVDSLEAGLWQEDEVIATTPVFALWLPKRSILLSLKGNKKKLSHLSEAFGAIMGRSDLDIRFKLVLGKLEEHPEPTREEICEALKQLKISESHLAEVEQLWLGDLAWTIRLLKPMLLILNSEARLGPIAEINSEEELKHYLENQNLGPLKTDDALSITRNCDGFSTLGTKLFDTVGIEFQLDCWNQALTRLDELPVRNEDAVEQFKDHLATAHVPLRAILRRILRDNPGMELFNTLADQLDNVSCPDEYAKNYWIVEFGSVMQLVKPLFITWQASSEELKAIYLSKSAEDLIERLEKLELEPTLDPLEIYAQNRNRCLALLQMVQQAAIIWCLRIQLQTVNWEKETDELLAQINDTLDREGFIDLWSDTKSFSALKRLSRDDAHKVFWDEFDASSNFGDFLNLLSISSDDLKQAKGKLERYKEKVREKKRMVTLCGKDFDSSEDNFEQLWNHIVDGIDEKDLPEVSFDRLADLKEVSPGKGRQRNGNGKKRRLKPKGRINQAMKNLIGLAGEIHAYRVLLKTYGPRVMNPSCWISENSLRKFPQNTVDDDFGCDFVIHHKRKAFYIEVKATEGEEEVFELGLSQIRRSIEVANKRNAKFLILHITKALSTEPEFQFLPNPYDRQYQRSYDIRNAGLKIRYKKSS